MVVSGIRHRINTALGGLMSAAQRPQETSLPLSAAERDWIRRQGASARVQEAERRHLRERLAAAQVELSRLRTHDSRTSGRFTR
jgi:hypothetical protein